MLKHVLWDKEEKVFKWVLILINLLESVGKNVNLAIGNVNLVPLLFTLQVIVGQIGIGKDHSFLVSKLPLIKMFNVQQVQRNGDFYVIKKFNTVTLLVIKNVV